MHSSIILIMIEDNFRLRYFHPVITLLLESAGHSLILVARTGEIANDIKRHFPATPLLTGFTSEVFHTVVPNIIICNQIWWWDISPVLDAAVKLNIPILHYEHGSLIYMSEYLLENNEFSSGYRNNVYLCSHIACWGERNKECWVSYGVPEEKLFLVGAVHLDQMYKAPARKELVCEALEITSDKKIIFIYTKITGQFPHFDSIQIHFIDRLEAFAEANPQYQLVIKPHPSEMLWLEQPRHHYSSMTKMIAHPIQDCAWPNVIRINADDVVAVSTVVVSPFSSALLTPLSLNIPIILMQYETELVNNFVKYCGEYILAIPSAVQLPQAIELVTSATNFDCSKLAAQFNHGNDGNACTRFIDLMEMILEDQRNGKNFYLKEEEELLLSVRRYPFLPYPYHYLIKYYMGKGDGTNVDHWLGQYLKKFNDPVSILRELAMEFFNVWKDYERVQHYIMLHRKYKPLDFELLHMYKLTFNNN